MRFFTIASAALTVSLAAFTVAAPVAETEAQVAAAQQSNESILSLWTAAFTKITPQAQSFTSLNSSTATTETILPKLQSIQKSLQALHTGVTGLQNSGAPLSQLLSSADGSSQLSVPELASHLAGDISTLVNGLGVAHGSGDVPLSTALGSLLLSVGSPALFCPLDCPWARRRPPGLPHAPPPRSRWHPRAAGPQRSRHPSPTLINRQGESKAHEDAFSRHRLSCFSLIFLQIWSFGRCHWIESWARFLAFNALWYT
ncbi:hypothetical protein CONPUDRAFT_169454 [Coniophora puteana RWD-64-598 SS2]|uniref:Uncharacterized protein n=1 Tax=Coniophora puteana (strain RWD-64-598) TaxID=741705 RepID=A0A5M3MAQ7_CONPW|nr:uncharacterized protein CONPUDRAFT_169454 [Coniophora puteana RWD-64-598 SS2]EIW75705.1 hypothetical protein CONPUDRAFT_169454 [Coniophora puteana RWD-64-598 SS2]